MTELFTHSAPNQIVCMDCGETILYLENSEMRQSRLYPVRCDACVLNLIESGIADREGYTHWEVRYVP